MHLYFWIKGELLMKLLDISWQKDAELFTIVCNLQCYNTLKQKTDGHVVVIEALCYCDKIEKNSGIEGEGEIPEPKELCHKKLLWKSITK